MKQLVKKIKINTTITLLTGMHIGGSKENVEIGGIDNPVIKLASKGDQPYIPGSSLKGKMRCLLEQVAGAVKVGDDTEVNNMFGTIKGTTQPSKIIVRDAYLTEKSLELFKNSPSLDMPYTENKFENTIDRVKGVAEHPRQTERVPAGAEFAVEFILNVWDDDADGSNLLKMLEHGIALIESDYLGGSGSRGYGQVKFGELVKVELTPENNWKA
ncbi:MAG: type III-A CRISPR-associated RAMP protein Csm3 [Bacteroidales bacterium]|nr:type III-A CRISPR-associated RAMP protein Csm3 [Bacteroidales bacterium]